MIVQNCNLLLEILTKIESIISDQKAQFPFLNEEEIIENIKNQLKSENNN